MNKIRMVTVCPRCHSSNYYISNRDGLITGQRGMYICNNCGFEGIIFPNVNLDKISKIKKINKPNIPENIKLKDNKVIKINLLKLSVVLLLILLIYAAYRFGLFDFGQPSHKHAIDFFSRYRHIK